MATQLNATKWAVFRVKGYKKLVISGESSAQNKETVSKILLLVVTNWELSLIYSSWSSVLTRMLEKLYICDLKWCRLIWELEFLSKSSKNRMSTLPLKMPTKFGVEHKNTLVFVCMVSPVSIKGIFGQSFKLLEIW